MKLDLNNKTFQSQINTTNGEVSALTIFHYRQEGSIIWAEYGGGQIIRGFLVGKIVDDYLLFTYQHINEKQELMTGKCKSYPELLENGKLLLKEYWEWTCDDFSKGESEIVEI